MSNEVKTAQLDDFTLQYVTTALWSSFDDDNEPLDNKHSIDNIDPHTLNTMIADCAKFQKINQVDIEKLNGDPDGAFKDSTIGHDFWLTRNYHGAGFWDGDYPQPQAERLEKSSHGFGECCLYIGDDGLIYS